VCPIPSADDNHYIRNLYRLRESEPTGHAKPIGDLRSLNLAYVMRRCGALGNPRTDTPRGPARPFSPLVCPNRLSIQSKNAICERARFTDSPCLVMCARQGTVATPLRRLRRCLVRGGDGPQSR
jgi:hypothetical protein